MNLSRRLFAGLAAGVSLFVSGCAGQMPAADAPARAALARTGSLRVGVYPGSPTSLVRDTKTGERAGVAYDLGTELGRQLGVPVKIVEFSRVAQVIDALKAQQVDFTFTNATGSRARDVDFTAPLIRLELGDAFATNKGILFEMSDELPGYHVLDGRWGLESLAIAVPKGREAGMPFLRGFAQEMHASGRLQAIIARAGLRGTARTE